MKKHATAYEVNAEPQLNNVVKCEKCGFGAVLMQWRDCGDKCPKCGQPLKEVKFKGGV